MPMFSMFVCSIFQAATSTGIHIFMAAFDLGMNRKRDFQDRVFKHASHVIVLTGVTSNGKTYKKMLIRPTKIFEEGRLWEEKLRERGN